MDQFDIWFDEEHGTQKDEVDFSDEETGQLEYDESSIIDITT